MRHIIISALVLCAGSTTVLAGGIDRSSGLQEQDLLFHDGNYFKAGVISTSPDLKGKHSPVLANQLGPRESGEFAADMVRFFGGAKFETKGKFDFIVAANNDPWSAEAAFPNGTGYYGAGTNAEISSTNLTGLVAFKPRENISLFAGPRFQSFEGEINVAGPAFGVFNGYSTDFDKDNSVGYVAGATFEKPEIGMQIGLTYASEIDHEFDVTESATTPQVQGAVSATSGQKATATTPQSATLSFRTGIAPKTALLGSVRWVDWDKYHITTPAWNAVNNRALHSFREDTTTYRLGLGRRFTEELSGSLMFTYEDGHGKSSNHLSPRDGFQGVGLGLNYKKNKFDITGVVNYIEAGDTFTELPNAQTGQTFTAATYEDGSAVTVGITVGYEF